jgi:hypothetical protein
MPDDLPQLLDQNLGRDVQAGAPHTLIEVSALGREGRTELAELLAGTTNKKTREYRSARRQVERWAKKPGTKIKTRSRQRLRGAGREARSPRLQAFRRHGAEMRLQIEWYVGRRLEWVPAGRTQHIPREAMRRVIRTWAEGEIDEAAGLLLAEFAEQYKVPDVLDWLPDVVIHRLHLEPTR